MLEREVGELRNKIDWTALGRARAVAAIDGNLEVGAKVSKTMSIDFSIGQARLRNRRHGT